MKILKNRNFENVEIFENFQNFEISKFPKFRFFKIFIFCSEKNRKIFFNFLFAKIFWSRKIFFENIFCIYQLKFAPRFQKSYLENRAIDLSMRKLQLYFVSMFETHGITHLVTFSGPPLTWGPQAGSEVMSTFFRKVLEKT